MTEEERVETLCDHAQPIFKIRLESLELDERNKVRKSHDNKEQFAAGLRACATYSVRYQFHFLLTFSR